MKDEKNSLLVKFIYAIIFVLLICFIIIPVVSVVLYGIKTETGFGVSLKTIARSFSLLKNSLYISITVTLVSTVLGLVMSITLNRIRFLGRSVFKVLALLPFVNPPFVGSISFIMLFGRRGLITNKFLNLDVSPYGAHGIIIIQILGLSSLAYILISSSIKKFDTTLEDSARNLGATEGKIFRSITFPLMTPEISNTALLVFLASMADFTTPLIIGGSFQTLASDLYIQITGVYDMKSASVSGIVLLIPCLIVFIIHKYYRSKKVYFSEENLSRNIEYTTISSRTRYFLITISGIFLFIVFIKYFFIIVGAFTEQWGYNYNLTFKHFESLFSRQYKPFINSIKLAVVSALAGSFLGILSAYLLKTKKLFMSKFADFAATLPAAVPGILFGIGYLVTFKYPILGIGRWVFVEKRPLLLLGTGIIIYIITTARFINTGLRSGYALLEHINPDLEKASHNLGSSEINTFRKITWPLMKDAFFASYLRNFSSGMITLGAIIFLLLPSNKVAVQQIFQIITSSSIGEAASMALLLSVITLILLGVFYLMIFFGKNDKIANAKEIFEGIFSN